MRPFIISTESTADLPEYYCIQHHVDVQPLFYIFGDEIFGDQKKLTPEEFYNRMRAGQMPTTNASNPESIKLSFEKRVQEGKDILHIAFSSALSSSYSNAILAANEVKSKYPEANILVIDSLSASLGQGLLVYYAVEKLESGCSLQETYDWVEQNRLHLCHEFTVDDLFHLHRGGRVSKTAAIIGTLINVKPMLHVDDNGALIPLKNVHGRKKALLALVDEMEAHTKDIKNDIVFISHSDCEEDAKFVADTIRKRFGISSSLIHFICPTIGSHTGPGTVALFYLGNSR